MHSVCTYILPCPLWTYTLFATLWTCMLFATLWTYTLFATLWTCTFFATLWTCTLFATLWTYSLFATLEPIWANTTFVLGCCLYPSFIANSPESSVSWLSWHPDLTGNGSIILYVYTQPTTFSLLSNWKITRTYKFGSVKMSNLSWDLNPVASKLIKSLSKHHPPLIQILFLWNQIHIYRGFQTYKCA